VEVKTSRNSRLVTALNQALVGNFYFWKMKHKTMLPDIKYQGYSGKKAKQFLIYQVIWVLLG